MSTDRTRWQIRAERSIEYDVLKTRDLFSPENEVMLSGGKRNGGRRFVVVDGAVWHYHGEMLRSYFVARGVDARIVVFPGAEEHKTIETFQDLLRELDAFPIHRHDEPIIAIGGGVLTDVVGFVAASYRRGLPYIKVPTTLMGYVDASLGIKVGINFNGNKNRIGAFAAPLVVLLDKTFLRTLPRRHLLNGVCEIIKLAIIRDVQLFERLEIDGPTSVANSFGSAAGDALLDRAITGMLDELAPNLYEGELTRRVDFGHTFSYGLEVSPRLDLLHGEAVLLDILVSISLARRRDMLTERDVGRVFALIGRLGIQPDLSLLDAGVMWASLLDRIEHRNGEQRVPMPVGLGRCVFLNDVTFQEIEVAIAALRARTDTSRERALER